MTHTTQTIQLHICYDLTFVLLDEHTHLLISSYVMLRVCTSLDFM